MNESSKIASGFAARAVAALLIAAAIAMLFKVILVNHDTRTRGNYQQCVAAAMHDTLKPGEYTVRDAELVQQVILVKSSSCMLVQK